MTDHEIWRAEAAGVLAAESSEFRLLVQAPEAFGGAVRFLVLRRGAAGEGAESLFGSGIRDDVRSAMQAAERMADSWARLGLLETDLSR